MESAKVHAKIAEEVPYVCINGSSTRARFAMQNVHIAKRGASAMFVLQKNANKARFSVSMGSKKNDA